MEDSATDKLVTTCPRGICHGTSSAGVTVYPRIVYAAAPRFAASGLVETTAEPEHPLVLSITAPTHATPLSDYPVLVFIHGGGYEGGHYQEPWLNATALAQARIITVSVEYRTGIDGFVPFHDDTPHHYRGIDDCALALDWVQENIESFGGDPTNVTLMGHSAGAGIALWLGRKDHYKGTFRRIWALSPAFPHTSAKRRKAALRRALTAPITRTGLLKKTDEQLQRGYRRYQRFVFFDLPLGPTPFQPHELVDIPIIISCTREEMLIHNTARRIDASWWRGIARPIFRNGVGMSGSWQPPRLSNYLGYLIGDAMIRRPVVHALENAPGQCWAIEYRGTPTQPVVHCADIPWVFNNTELLPPGIPEINYTPAEQLVDTVHQYAITFIRGTLPDWPTYRPKRSVLGIDITGDKTILTDPFGYIRDSST
ncbi:MAG: alpha/beta fold hydrolase [Corynebacterium sp.]|uniref:alpha/beta fold hydrolase n=1 Tax=Corynebacterium sp. TaxID=1720 RepID=UPI0026DCD918|nr:alpha/beta fold hydrolase [Corynebacterium sp.]MDO5098686.1 alpha/beta fold hydrolase [Corynebacterium sp.]